jgi:hypothetical protein
MVEEELISKLKQIEEQARLTLEEFPKRLARERQRMIIALAKYIRADLEDRTLTPADIARFPTAPDDVPNEH